MKESGLKEKWKDIVYSVKYNVCDSTHTGETICMLNARMEKHERHTRKEEILKLAVADHACLFDHAIDWKSVNILDYTCDFQQRKITDGLCICKHTGAVDE